MKSTLLSPISLALALVSPPALAQAADPATGSVQMLQSGILGIMRAGSGAGQAGRARMIAPAIDRAFDIPLMTRLAVGPAWTGIPAREQAELVAAFRSLTIAQHAKKVLNQLRVRFGNRFASAPFFRCRSVVSSSSDSSSAIPLAIVLGSQPKSREMYSIPPCPSLAASTAAYRRRSRSFKDRQNRTICRSVTAGYSPMIASSCGKEAIIHYSAHLANTDFVSGLFLSARAGVSSKPRGRVDDQR